HLESGYTTEDPEEIVAMQDKRKKKWESIEKDVLKRNPVKVYGDEESDKLILTWGSTKGAVLEAMKLIDEPVKLVQPIYFKPFPLERISEHLERAEKVIDVEANSTAQLGDLIKRKPCRPWMKRS
ncbi:hypothetical protein AKJ41_06075, partial [candidate division MSBL1 archaeon SCGC-AAA259O05]